MLWVKLGTHITDHPRFLEMGARARDLWTWGMLYSGRHELDGELPIAAVLGSAWGYGTRRNAEIAETLVTLGLWERTEFGYRILRWSEQGNETKASISSKRAATKVRVDRFRNGVTNGVANALCSTSNSLSPSGYGSGSQIASPAEAPPPSEVEPMPEWFGVGACDAVAMVLGGNVDDRPARWVEYSGARHRKGWAMNHTDAVGWLSTVLRSERARATSRSGAPGKTIVQSAVNRAWKLPEGLE